MTIRPRSGLAGRHLIACALVALLGISLGLLSTHESAYGVYSPKRDVTIGTTETLKASVPSGVSRTKWKSTSPKIASVVGKGKAKAKGSVKGKTPGLTTVIANAGGKIRCWTVLSKEPPVITKEISVEAGESFPLSVGLAKGVDAASWLSFDKSIAIVQPTTKSSAAIMTAKPGTTTIRARVGHQAYKWKLTVTEAPADASALAIASAPVA